MPFKDHKDTWATIGSVVQIGAIVIGGSFAMFKYIDAEHAQRTKETLVYVDRYQKSPLHELRMKLEGVWMRHEDALVAKIEADNDAGYEQFVLGVIRNEELEQVILPLLNFFESIHACSQARICDESTARSFFCGDAVPFHNLYFRYIADVRRKRNDPGWAQALEKFVNATCRS